MNKKGQDAAMSTMLKVVIGFALFLVLLFILNISGVSIKEMLSNLFGNMFNF